MNKKNFIKVVQTMLLTYAVLGLLIFGLYSIVPEEVQKVILMAAFIAIPLSAEAIIKEEIKKAKKLN